MRFSVAGHPAGAVATRQVARVGAWTVAGALAAVGLTVLGTGLVVLLVAATVLCGAGGGVLARRAPGRRVLGDTADCALFGAASVLVGAGATVLIGPVAVPLTLAGVAAAGWRHWYRSVDGPGPHATAPSSGDVATWSNAELAREWGRSHGRLRTVRDAAALDGLRELRRTLLDEMERRDPVGFRRWTDGGAWITGSTAPFLGT